MAARETAPPSNVVSMSAFERSRAEGDKSRRVIFIDPDEDAVYGANALGNFVFTLKPTVRNFTGRAVSGLEFRAAGFDLDGKVIRERTFARDVDIEPNRVTTPSLGLNFPPDRKPAQLKLELTGVRFR